MIALHAKKKADSDWNDLYRAKFLHVSPEQAYRPRAFSDKSFFPTGAYLCSMEFVYIYVVLY